MHQRKQIRDYIHAKFSAALPLDGRVFMQRPSPAFTEELPCVFMYIDAENVETLDGDKFCPRSYLRTLKLAIEIVTYGGMDHVDELAEHIEWLMANDQFLGRDLSQFDPEKPEGLCEGLSLASCTPYEVETETSQTIYGQKLSFDLPYVSDLHSTRKYKTFKEYYFDMQLVEGKVDL